jgi:hypothetical protein
MTFTVAPMLVLIGITGLLALIDGVNRTRRRGSNTVLAVLELVLGIAVLITLFATLPVPFLWVIVGLEIVLALTLVVGGRGSRKAPALTIVALVLNSLVLVLTLGWVDIPWLG